MQANYSLLHHFLWEGEIWQWWQPFLDHNLLYSQSQKIKDGVGNSKYSQFLVFLFVCFYLLLPYNFANFLILLFHTVEAQSIFLDSSGGAFALFRFVNLRCMVSLLFTMSWTSFPEGQKLLVLHFCWKKDWVKLTGHNGRC